MGLSSLAHSGVEPGPYQETQENRIPGRKFKIFRKSNAGLWQKNSTKIVMPFCV